MKKNTNRNQKLDREINREINREIAMLNFQRVAVVCGVVLAGMFMIYSIVLVIEDAPDEKLGRLAFIGPIVMIIFFAFAFGRAFSFYREVSKESNELKTLKKTEVKSDKNVT